jgi:hypothetical protein
MSLQGVVTQVVTQEVTSVLDYDSAWAIPGEQWVCGLDVVIDYIPWEYATLTLWQVEGRQLIPSPIGIVVG